LSEVAANQHVGTKQAQKRARKAVEVEKEAGQLSMLSEDDFRLSTSVALNSITAIERNPGVTIKDVKAQEAAYDELRQRFSEKYEHLANLGAAMYYDLEVDSKLWRPLADYALGKSVVQTPQFERLLGQATALAEKKRFFHWELEFPDISL